MTVPFQHQFSCPYGASEALSPLIRRVVADNPGPFTFHGTGTYIVGRGQVAVIDPGPALAAHVEALVRALGDERVSHILVTHTHLDHSPASRRLARLTGAPVLGYGPHGSGRNAPGRGRAADRVEAGADLEFAPDRELRHGDVVAGPDWTLECVHTPGHTSNHLCFSLREEETLFSGDHVMGWSSTVISPPDGDMGDYLASLRLLLQRDERRYWPTHGPCIEQPRTLVSALLQHRLARQQQIVGYLRAHGAATIDAMLPTLYPGLDPRLLPAAARSTFAGVLYLLAQGRLRCDGEIALEGVFELAG